MSKGVNYGGWANLYARDGSLHCIPINDTRPHKRSADCWCNPEEDAEVLFFVHNSADGREDFEKGLRKPS